MIETITLPRSGLTLRGSPRDGYTHEEIPFAWIAMNSDEDATWLAQCGREDNDIYGTRDECIAWLDEQLLKRRAALLPPGAFLVRDDEGTRERVASAMLAAHAERYDMTSAPDGETVKASRQYAEAVLRALREASR